MKADLHMHTNYSDGILSVKSLILLAKEKGMDVISITDHDTLAAYKEIKNADILIIKGIELSTIYNNESIHLLGYFPANANTYELEEYLKTREMARKDRASRIFGLLKKNFNIDIDFSDFDNNLGVIARPHIARAIVKKGYPYTIKEIFEKMIGEGCSCYIPSTKISTSAGIALLKRNHGLVVLAHPVELKNVTYQEIINMGIDGIEAKYPANPIGYERKLRDETDDKVFYTAGSDFHGDESHSEIGTVYLTDYELKLFLRKLGYQQ